MESVGAGYSLLAPHTPMTTKYQARVTPREVARILFRHRRKMAMFFAAAVSSTLAIIAFYPRSYSSESKLFIRVGRESVGLDPTATTGQTIMLQKSQFDEVNSALDILNSHEVQRRVVEQIGADRILREEPTMDSAAQEPGVRVDSWATKIRRAPTVARSWLDTALAHLRLSDPGTETDRAIRQVADGVRVWAPKQSTIITIRYVAGSPRLAHDVVDAITKVFLDEHRRLNQTEGSLAFFTEQADSLHREVTAAQAELRDQKNAFQVASINSRRTILEQQIQNVDIERLGVARDLAFTGAKVDELARAIAGLEPELVTNRVAGFANEAKDGMREKLYELEIEETKLRARYNDDHPLLLQIQRQRKQAEEILTNLPDARTQTTAALNPNQRKLELELMQATATAEALRAREKTAQGQHAQLRTDLQALNNQEVQLAELERKVELLDGKYRMHVEKLEQARLNDAMGRDGIRNIQLAQPASLVLKPVSPNKRLTLAVGLMIGLVGSFGWALLAENLDQTLRTTQQVERQLGLPVLASFPRSKRGSLQQTKPIKTALNGSRNGRNGHYSAGKYGQLARQLLSTGRNGDDHSKMVGVVGCDASTLRSQVAADLALQAAGLAGKPVLLIDADSHGRRVAKRFQLGHSPGWHEVMAGVTDAESCIYRQETSNLAVMAPGATNGHAAAMALNVGVLGQLDEIKEEYGLVVVDLPSAQELDGQHLSGDWVDEVVMVVEAECTRIHAAQRAVQMFERSGVHVAGIVLANRREHIPRWLYQRL
jgi:polysaccharide biosynthesis transport protein